MCAYEDEESYAHGPENFREVGTIVQFCRARSAVQKFGAESRRFRLQTAPDLSAARDRDVRSRETPARHRDRGAAIIEEDDASTLVHPGWTATVDEHANLVLRP